MRDNPRFYNHRIAGANVTMASGMATPTIGGGYVDTSTENIVQTVHFGMGTSLGMTVQSPSDIPAASNILSGGLNSGGVGASVAGNMSGTGLSSSSGDSQSGDGDTSDGEVSDELDASDEKDPANGANSPERTAT